MHPEKLNQVGYEIKPARKGSGHTTRSPLPQTGYIKPLIPFSDLKPAVIDFFGHLEVVQQAVLL